MQGTAFSGGSLQGESIKLGRHFQPLVPAKKTEAPPASLNSIKDLPPLWWVCTTHISYDIARKFYNARLDYYLPIETRKVDCIEGRGDKAVKRKRKKQFPLFPGWIFLNGESSRNLAYDLYLRPQALHPLYQNEFHNDLLEIEDKLLRESVEPILPKVRKGDKIAVTGGTFGTVEGMPLVADRIDSAKRRIEGHLKNGIVFDLDLSDIGLN